MGQAELSSVGSPRETRISFPMFTVNIVIVGYGTE